MVASTGGALGLDLVSIQKLFECQSSLCVAESALSRFFFLTSLIFGVIRRTSEKGRRARLPPPAFQYFRLFLISPGY